MNTFGRVFRVTTCGESHGPVIACIIDGCPPGLVLSESDIQMDLDRRKPGMSLYVSQRRESDRVKILSGVFQGMTTGSPILLEIQNEDSKSKDYQDLADKFRPNHADYTYFKKYGIRDWRGGGRSSARETVARVAAGAVARKWLTDNTPIRVRGFLAQMGEIKADVDNNNIDWDEINKNGFFSPDKSKVALMEDYIQRLRKDGDSIGAKVIVHAQGVPVGLGEPLFDKLDAVIASALMSIPAVKAVEIGDGVDCILQRGSQHRDEMHPNGFYSNHSGGIIGGISTGQTIIASCAFKPTSSILIPARTVNIDNQACEVVTKGRHDPCVGVRATPIVEAMMCLVLIDSFLMQIIKLKN